MNFDEIVVLVWKTKNPAFGLKAGFLYLYSDKPLVFVFAFGFDDFFCGNLDAVH